VILIPYGLARRDRKGSLNDGRIQNPSNPFGIVPLSTFVPRGFKFVHHSLAILYHEVPNPYLTIRNFYIAVQPALAPARGPAHGPHVRRRGGQKVPALLLLRRHRQHGQPHGEHGLAHVHPDVRALLSTGAPPPRLTLRQKASHRKGGRGSEARRMNPSLDVSQSYCVSHTPKGLAGGRFSVESPLNSAFLDRGACCTAPTLAPSPQSRLTG
jgi:hypothetical protein